MARNLFATIGERVGSYAKKPGQIWATPPGALFDETRKIPFDLHKAERGGFRPAVVYGKLGPDLRISVVPGTSADTLEKRHRKHSLFVSARPDLKLHKHTAFLARFVCTTKVNDLSYSLGKLKPTEFRDLLSKLPKRFLVGEFEKLAQTL